jgi:hypothetical protein
VKHASSTTTVRSPRSTSPIADCATHTSVSKPASTAVPRPVARIAATISGAPPRPNASFSSTGVPAGTRCAIRGSVGPSRSGPSSVTTTGMSSREASPASHAIAAITASPRAPAAKPGWASTITRTESVRSTSGIAHER